MAIAVKSEIKAIEVDEDEAIENIFSINSHWIRNESFVLVTPDGKKYNFNAKDFRNAIDNATNR